MVRHLEILEKRARIEGYIETVTALHVGAGRGMQATGSDMPVMLDAYGRPFIPGSSFKGSLRSQVEAALRAVAAQRGEDPKCWSCDVVSEDYCIPDKEDWQKDASFILERACRVCKLFGAPYLASRVYISDLAVDPKTWDPLLLQVRDGVAIDRESQTAAEKKKFDLEVILPGVRFQLEIVVENPTDEELGLLLWALQLYDDGYARIGGASSRGTGRVRLIITDMQTRSIADFFATPTKTAVATPVSSSQPVEPEAPDRAQEEEARLSAALDKLREVLTRVPSITLARLQKDGPSLYGLSKRRLREYGVKSLDQLIKLAQERGLIRVEGQQISLMAAQTREEQPEQPPELNRLQEYLRRYLPALQRWIQEKGKGKGKPEEQPTGKGGDSSV